MGNKTYELIEHTADVGIRVKADSLRELFRKAAWVMFDIISERKGVKAKSPRKIKITQEADDLEELFINWLNELLFLSATKELIFSDFKINKLGQNHLEAIALGDDVANYRVNTEIKAATYHQLKIEEQGAGWLAEVIFDV